MDNKCTCKSKSSFLHLSYCDLVDKPKIPLDFLQNESRQFPGGIIFYVTADEQDAIKQLTSFRSSLREGDWMYEVQTGSVGSITMANTTEVTFLPESEAFILLELPNSTSIFYELTDKNKDLAEQLTLKTQKIQYVDPTTKELMNANTG